MISRSAFVRSTFFNRNEDRLCRNKDPLLPLMYPLLMLSAVEAYIAGCHVLSRRRACSASSSPPFCFTQETIFSNCASWFASYLRRYGYSLGYWSSSRVLLKYARKL